MKKIMWISTGGTISCVMTDKGLSPAAAESQMHDMLRLLPQTEADISVRCLMNTDSTEISCGDMRRIGIAVNDAIVSSFDGVVVTHGTDTMAYTSAMLDRMISCSPVPVIITGSQRPFFDEGSDGRANLGNAFAAALDSRYKGVYLLFGDRIIKGGSARKAYSRSDSAFISNSDRGYVPAAETGEYRFDPDFDERVMLIKITPSTEAAIFDHAAQRGMKGIVIEGYGLGGIPRRLLGAVKSAADKGIKIMLISQCFFEGVDMSVYEVGRAAAECGVISGGTLCAEAALAEMMFIVKEQ